MSGLFVSFEGIDRSGKTTQARMLCQALGSQAVCVREPGGTPLGERVRALLSDPSIEIGAPAEAFLFASARAQLVSTVVRPALDRGQVVVCDRYLDSSLAYQGAGRGIGVDEIAGINRLATDDLAPDLTVLLWIDPDHAALRAGREDRFERDGIDLQRRVLAAYERLAKAQPDRFLCLAADRPQADIHEEVMRAFRDLQANTGTTQPRSGR
jgi:dTMP kinase